MQTGELNGYHYVYKPCGADSHSVLLLLHGTGGTEHDLVSFAEEVAPSAGIISLRGNVSEHGHARFFRRLAEGIFDEDDIKKRSADIAEFIRLAKIELGIEDASIVALGFSNGANMASALLTLHAGVLAGAVLLRAMVTIRPSGGEASVSAASAQSKVLLMSGKHDQLVSEENANELAAILRESGASSVDHVWLEAGHGLTNEDLAHVRKWLTLNLK